MQRTVQLAVHKKQKTHTRKLSKLSNQTVNTKTVSTAPEIIENFVINESSEKFEDDELNLLNMGLKFTPKPAKIEVLESIVDIESMLKFKLPSIQNDIRAASYDIIDSFQNTHKPNVSAKKQFETIKKLKEKNFLYTKADKGNQIVILDKSDYE